MDLKTTEVGIVGVWTILLNGMVTPSILMAPIPGASWPFCCQAVNTRQSAPSKTSSKRWVWWSTVVCNTAERQHLTMAHISQGSREDVCCICGCDSSRKLMAPKSAIAPVVAVIVTTWNGVGWILILPILINHHFSSPWGGSLHPNNLSNPALWPHQIRGVFLLFMFSLHCWETMLPVSVAQACLFSWTRLWSGYITTGNE